MLDVVAIEVACTTCQHHMRTILSHFATCCCCQSWRIAAKIDRLLLTPSTAVLLIQQCFERQLVSFLLTGMCEAWCSPSAVGVPQLGRQQ